MLSCARVISPIHGHHTKECISPIHAKGQNSIDKPPKIEHILIGNIVKQVDAMQESEEFARSFDQSRPLINKLRKHRKPL